MTIKGKERFKKSRYYEMVYEGGECAGAAEQNDPR